MIRFAELYNRLDATTKTNEKVAAMVDYFDSASAEDAAWATYFLSGNRLRRLVPTKLLRQWAAEEAGIPGWLFEESYHSVGDLAETISLVVPPGEHPCQKSLANWVANDLQPLRTFEEKEQRDRVLQIWAATSTRMRFVVMKLITGAFRVGVSKRLLTRALSKHSGVSADVISHRLMGDWRPSEESFLKLIDPDEHESLMSRPYPFCLAHALDSEEGVKPLGEISQFAAEWKWDGIRGQIIRRQSKTFLWSRGEVMMENTWPEVESAAESLPNGTVIDGEILAAVPGGSVLPFEQLQRRIGRKKIGKKLLLEVPVIFHAFDLLEIDGCDVRGESFAQRRRKLAKLLQHHEHPHLCITRIVKADSWDELASLRQQSREHLAEGLMLKRLDATYDVGRVRGTWWKWKVDPHTIDAVLIYAQKGHGRRADLFTDYTFAVWDGERLVPFAKAYSGLSDQEIRKVDRFVRQNTHDKFGPVRSVTPSIVMELAFEGLQLSKRHKCGVATRFPRIVRWRHDKRPADANTLDELKALLQ